MADGKTASWSALIAGYLAGQGLVNLLNLLVGLILLWVLPVREFALYTVATALLQGASVGSDMGLTHAINTMGARLREDKGLLGGLYAGARFYGYRLYAVSACVVVAISTSILPGHGWAPGDAASVLFLILLTTLLQVTVNFRQAVLNINHDSKALFYAGIAQAGVRVLCVPLCLVWPSASFALLGNLAGVLACNRMMARQCRPRLDENRAAAADQKEALRKFIIPLMPVHLYYALQGQISIFLLAYYGYTASIAEVGALGRLGQLIGLLLLLNSFYVMPVFSRISQRAEFIRQGGRIVFALAVFVLAVMATVYLFPGGWLYILGGNYSGLEKELPLAVLTALLGLMGGVLYVLVISRSSTSGQVWYVVLGLTSQLVFLALHGAHSTYDALWLNLMPVLSYACVQAALLARILHKWKDDAVAA